MEIMPGNEEGFAAKARERIRDLLNRPVSFKAMRNITAGVTVAVVAIMVGVGSCIERKLDRMVETFEQKMDGGRASLSGRLDALTDSVHGELASLRGRLDAYRRVREFIEKVKKERHAAITVKPGGREELISFYQKTYCPGLQQTGTADKQPEKQIATLKYRAETEKGKGYLMLPKELRNQKFNLPVRINIPSQINRYNQVR